MNIEFLIKTSSRTIIKHKVRSLLTILGIMIGIAAIIVTFSIGRGAEEAIRRQIMSMGEGAIYIMPMNITRRGAMRHDIQEEITITKADVASIAAQSPEIAEITPFHITSQTIKYKDVTLHESTIGAYENILEIFNKKLTLGKFFTKYHVDHGIRVAVLGDIIAEKLFKKEYPIGKIITINNTPFEVIGIMEHMDQFFGPQDPNARIFIPFTGAKKYCRLPNEPEERLGAICMSVKPETDASRFLRKLKNILRFNHNTKETDPDDFTVFDQKTIEESATKAASIIKLFGLIAASISLLVGGIGVMNIMLVSVKERTQEIGLRMAIGATQKVIQFQFLLESIILCTFGGLIGIALGTSAQIFLSRATNLPGVIEIIPMLISLLTTIAVGVFFGYFPAYQASKLDPVDALQGRQG